jgi:transposase
MDASRFPTTMPSSTKEGSMALELLAIDLGKRSFHLYGIDTDGVILSRKVSRAKLAEVVGDLAPTTIAMEACASAHYWGRCWLAAGRVVRLMNPRFVKAFVKGSKNDAVDAEAIFEAAMRPTMRFVPVKSTDQQDLQSLHRARDRLICQRTALINHTRGLLAEYGIVLPQGPWRFTTQAPTAVAGADLSDLARGIFGELLDQLDELDRRVKKLDTTMVALCRTNETCRRLAKLPGVGPVVATAIVAAVNDGRQFRSGREMAAWIGLVPRQYTTGGKPRLGGIGRRANHYLRRQMIHGARAVVSRLPTLPKHDDRRSSWLNALVARRGFNRTIVALANKTARIAWALLNRREEYVTA